MEHKLQVVVRLDMDHHSATLDVTGCLTQNAVPALFPLIIRAGSMMGSLRVDVVVNQAAHIDQAGLNLLTAFAADPTRSRCKQAVHVSAPATLPPCPTLQATQKEKVAA